MLIVKMAVQGPVEPKQSICPHQYQIYTLATYATVQAQFCFLFFFYSLDP